MSPKKGEKTDLFSIAERIVKRPKEKRPIKTNLRFIGNFERHKIEIGRTMIKRSDEILKTIWILE